MPWNSVPSKTGVTISAADWNTYIAGNLNAGIPMRLYETTLAADVAGSIDVQNIPQSFQHLQLIMSFRSTQNLALSSIFYTLNEDAATNYDHQHSYGQAATGVGGENFGVSMGQIGNVPALTATASVFGYAEIWFPNYSKTTGQKVGIARWGSKYGTATANLQTGQIASFWRSAAAITSIQLRDIGAVGWAAGSKLVIRGWP